MRHILKQRKYHQSYQLRHCLNSQIKIWELFPLVQNIILNKDIDNPLIREILKYIPKLVLNYVSWLWIKILK